MVVVVIACASLMLPPHRREQYAWYTTLRTCTTDMKSDALVSSLSTTTREINCAIATPSHSGGAPPVIILAFRRTFGPDKRSVCHFVVCCAAVTVHAEF